MTTPTGAPTADGTTAVAGVGEVAVVVGASGTAVVADASTTAAVGAVSVRYFAAAAEAAGVDTETVPAGTVAQVVAVMTSHHPDLATVLPRCALLADGTRVEGDDEVRAGVTLDVLPPFAGG